MQYRAIGIMSGSSLDGLDIVFAEFQEQGGHWQYEIIASECYPYPVAWEEKLSNAIHLSAREYQLLHTSYGHYIGDQVNQFIEQKHLQYKVSLISSHGHTSFHIPGQKMTAQLGDGAAIAAETQLPVVSDLRAMDLAFGGQGAPIVPIGEKWLLGDYDFFLNLGGIANVSFNDGEKYIAFDICAANRVLNLLANEAGEAFDEGGKIAAGGIADMNLLEELNKLDYYALPYPKSLANDFGTDLVYPIVKAANLSIPDSLRSYTEHVAFQISRTISELKNNKPKTPSDRVIRAGINYKLLVTGGGALNDFLIAQLSGHLKNDQIEVIIPEHQLVNFKEALVMAFIGVLRWRQEYNVLSSVTGAKRNSIGGALWMGTE